MRSRISPAVLALTIAASGPMPGDHGILVTPSSSPGPDPEPKKRQRKPQLSDREPRQRKSSRYPYARIPNPALQQAAADKRARKAAKRLQNQRATITGIEMARADWAAHPNEGLTARRRRRNGR